MEQPMERWFVEHIDWTTGYLRLLALASGWEMFSPRKIRTYRINEYRLWVGAEPELWDVVEYTESGPFALSLDQRIPGVH